LNTVKFKNVILTIILISTSLLFLAYLLPKYSFANSFDNHKWNVKITSDTKDLTSKETQDIIFKRQNNPNVADGKIAPGSKAIATIELDLNKTNYAVNFILNADTSMLSENFKLEAKIDNEPYIIGNTKTFELPNNKSFNEQNGKKIITLILTWKNEESNNNFDTILGASMSTLSIPITWTASQHI